MELMPKQTTECLEEALLVRVEVVHAALALRGRAAELDAQLPVVKRAVHLRDADRAHVLKSKAVRGWWLVVDGVAVVAVRGGGGDGGAGGGDGDGDGGGPWRGLDE